MKLHMHHIGPEQWAKLSQDMHYLVFKSDRHPTRDRVSGAWIAVDDDAKPFGYITYQEQDADTVYLQLGGVVAGKRGTVSTWRQYSKCLEQIRHQYKVIKTKVGAANKDYLMMALKAGFTIVGFEHTAQPLVLLEIRRK